MKSKDVLLAQKNEILVRMNQAITANDTEAFAAAFTEFSENIQETVMGEARQMVESVDTNVLASRGVRQLTSKETNYYQNVITAMKSSNPKQALTDLEDALPETVIDGVFDELVAAHPLLEMIDFQNTTGFIEYLVNTNSNSLAVWGTLTSEIVTELTSGFKKINMTLMKMSAFLPIAKSMLDLGPVWVDRYVRTILFEASAFGLEEAIINGDGDEKPIGMIRQVQDGVSVTDGKYPAKEAVAVTSLDPVSFGSLIGGMAVDKNGNARPVTKVFMIVNPIDYLTKVMPATTVRDANGSYINNVFPFPCEVIQSAQVASGKAVFGLPKRYFMGIGTAKSGKIEFSDEYKFLEDERVYLVKLYGYGMPLDNNAFVYADISDLAPTIATVLTIPSV